MRAFLVKAVVLVMLASFGWQSAWAARFIDLDGVWSEKYINSLSDVGVINAEPDGKFRPNQAITRALFAYWLVKVLGIENQPVSTKPSFPDVKATDWCYRPIEIIRQNNIISGYADGFRPNQLIQKAEAVSIIARTLNAPTPNDPAVTQALSQFSDKSKIPGWARVSVAQAIIAGVPMGPDANLLNPMSMATRGDTAAMLCALHQYITHASINDQIDTSGSYTAVAPNSGYGQGQGNSQPSLGNQGGMTPDAMASQPYGSPGYSQSYQDQNQYKGVVQKENQYLQSNGGYPSPQGFGGQYMQGQDAPQSAYAPQSGGLAGNNYSGGSTQTALLPNNYPMQAQTGQMGSAPSSHNAVLQGSVTTVSKGTKFDATLRTSLDSATSEPGEIIEATLSSPIYANGNEVIPAGSKLIGQVTDVVSAKRFKFGANGKIELKFTQVQTPDGRRFPLTASVDKKRVKLAGGSTAGRVGKSLLWTGVGAGGGALLGTAFGAMAGGMMYNPYTMTRNPMARTAGMGALVGGTLGGTAGLAGAAIRKGSEVKIKPGTELPIQLDKELQISGPGIAQQGFPAYQQGGGYSQAGYPQGSFTQQNYPQQ